MSQLEFDDALSRQIEGAYLIGDAVRRRGIVRAALAAVPGERIVDVGCGPGFYCRELVDEVGPQGAVVGVDSSSAMLGLAARRCAQYDNIELHESDALSLPLADDTADGLVCVQVLEYVGRVAGALAEMRRVLRPGGRVVLWDIDWPAVWWFSDDPERMRRVLHAWDEHLVHPGLPRTLAGAMRAAGFAGVHVQDHSFSSSTWDDDSYGGAILPLVAQFVAGRAGVTADEAAAWEAEQRSLADRGEFFFACPQYCFTALSP